jgi:stage III sporulation protein AA
MVKEILKQYAYGGLLEVFSDLCDKHSSGKYSSDMLLSDKLLERVGEIRIRQGLPLILRTDEGEIILPYEPTGRDISGTLDKMAASSLYAFDSEIKNGFITIPGGHRVGISGRVAMGGGKIKTIRHISGLTIRIARQILGAGEEILPHIKGNCLIISPPGQGKTTVLRDIIRLKSMGGRHISVVDERSEIAGSHLGAQQNDLGPRTDVLDAAPKAEGMLLMLRAHSPDIIAVDEIGDSDDIAAIMTVACCGVQILATLHGENIEDLRRKPLLAPLIENKIFDRYIFLTNRPNPGSLRAVYNEKLEVRS